MTPEISAIAHAIRKLPESHPRFEECNVWLEELQGLHPKGGNKESRRSKIKRFYEEKEFNHDKEGGALQGPMSQRAAGERLDSVLVQQNQLVSRVIEMSIEQREAYHQLARRYDQDKQRDAQLIQSLMAESFKGLAMQRDAILAHQQAMIAAGEVAQQRLIMEGTDRAKKIIRKAEDEAAEMTAQEEAAPAEESATSLAIKAAVATLVPVLPLIGGVLSKAVPGADPGATANMIAQSIQALLQGIFPVVQKAAEENAQAKVGRIIDGQETLEEEDPSPGDEEEVEAAEEAEA